MKRAVSVSLGSSTRDKRVVANFKGVEISIERIGTDGDVQEAQRLFTELDGEVDALGIVARSDKAGCSPAQAEGVVSIHVEIRADDEDEAVEQVLALTEEDIAHEHQQGFLGFRLVGMDVSLEIDDRFSGLGCLFRPGDPRVGQDYGRAGPALAARVHIDNRHIFARPS